MKKFKKIIVGAMLVMALGTFTACGNNDDNVNDTTGTQDNVTNDAANDETTGSNKNKNNNDNDTDKEMQSAMQWKMSVMQQGMLEKVS